MATETLKVEIEAYTDGYKQGLRDAWEETEQFEQKVEQSSKGIQQSSKQIGGAASVFIGTMAVKAIGALIQAGIKGMDNMYQFSAATGGQFHQAMDSVYSSFQSIKTALGSTFATILTSLAPIINQICDLVIMAANALSFFFAMLSGQSGYTKAVKQTASYGSAAANSLGSAAGSAEKLRKSLLGIDEINALTDPNSGGGGGGGGGGTGGVGDGLEWVEFDGFAAKASQFMGKVKQTVEKTIGDIVGLIKASFKAVGALLNGNEQEFREAMDEYFRIISQNKVFKWLYQAGTDMWMFFEDLFYNLKIGWKNLEIDIVTGWGNICALFNNGEVPQGIQDTIDKLEGQRDEIEKNHKATKEMIQAFRDSADVGYWITPGMNHFNKSLETVVSTAEDVITKINMIKSLSVNPITLGINIAKSSLEGFAAGGFPDEGSLFVAREAGPEMVGTIGGRTTVATNNDIVSAVSEGVAAAVAQVMGGGTGTSNTEVSVYMDSELVAKAADRGNRSLNRRFNVSLA